MQMTRGMRLDQAKAHVAGRLGVSTADLSDPLIMHEVRREFGLGLIPVQELTYPSEPGAIEAKFHISEVLDVPINSVQKFKRAHRPSRRGAAGRRDRAFTGGARVKRNLFAGRPRSGGLSLNVFTESELDDIHLATLEVLERTGVFVEADEALDIFADGGCLVDREIAHRAHPAARGRRRHPLGAQHVRALRPRGQERHRARARPRGLHQLQRGHPRDRPADGRAARFDEGRHRRHRPSQRLPLRHRHARDRGRRQGRAARDLRRAQRRGAVPEHHQADRHRSAVARRDRRHLPDGGGDRRRRRRAAPPADRLQRRLPGEPAQAAPRGHRGDHRDRRAGGSPTTS